jgi:hypothetical protein
MCSHTCSRRWRNRVIRNKLTSSSEHTMKPPRRGPEAAEFECQLIGSNRIRLAIKGLETLSLVGLAPG